MDILNYDCQEALKHQLFESIGAADLKQSLTGMDILNSRWLNFQIDILQTDEIVHLWASADFRRGYQAVIDMYNLVNVAWETKWKSKDGKPEFNQDELLDDIVDLICENENVRSFELLLESAQIIRSTITDDDRTVENYDKLMKDLGAFVRISRISRECYDVRKKHNTDIQDFLAVDDKDKRKPMKKAA